MWRILKYQTYPSPTPTVNIVKAKLPEVSEYFANHGLLTDMETYFQRPIQLHSLLYTEFHNRFIITKKITPLFQRKFMQDKDYFLIPIRGSNQTAFICPRQVYTITRMQMMYPTAGDVWYLRELLRRRSAISFDDLLTFEGYKCKTFQQSAMKHGYLDDINEAFRCFKEAMLFSTSFELRHLFATMTIHGFPTVDIFYDEEVFKAMTLDYTFKATQMHSREGYLNSLLLDLQAIFKEQNVKLSEFGLPEPLLLITEIDNERMKYDPKDQAILLQQLQISTPNNAEQDVHFQQITHAIEQGSTQKFFLIGQGGCGKTTIAKKILAFTRSKGLIAVGCASTGLAATNYDDFHTAHALFCYPVVDDEMIDESEPAQCDFQRNEDRLNLLRASSVIIWDEMISNHKSLYEAAYRALDGFAGKVLICMGDIRQIMPVLKRAERQEIENSCISSSYLFYKFQILKLTINMRLQKLEQNFSTLTQEEKNDFKLQKAYGEMILAIGEGQYHENADILNDNQADGIQNYRLNSIPFYTDTERQQAIDFLYPNGFDSNIAKDSCILAATNERGDMWNKLIQDMNPNPIHCLKSKDYMCEVDDPFNHLNNAMNTKALNSIKKTSTPEHELNLKVGDICIVLRNLSKSNGLATNSRVRILYISPDVIRVQTMSNPPQRASIPRIRFEFKIFNESSFKMIRIQFPLRLAYCMTYNKSQGQTLNKVLLDTVHSPFAHGHLYVALSRITSYKNIRIYCLVDNIFDGKPNVASVFFPELLNSV